MRFVDESGHESGVSPVIAVILLVAITVILSAVVGTFVLKTTDSMSGTAQAGVQVESTIANETKGTHNITVSSITMGSAKSVTVQVSSLPSGGGFTTSGTTSVKDVEVVYADGAFSPPIKYADASGTVVDTGTTGQPKVGGVADMDGDGDQDMAYINSSDNVVYTDSDGNVVAASTKYAETIGNTGDFDADGDQDIVFTGQYGDLMYSDGESTGYIMDSNGYVISAADVAAVGDYEGDGDVDVFYEGQASHYLHYVDANQNVVNTSLYVNNVGGMGDFDGDGAKEVTFSRDSTGTGYIWYMDDDGTAVNTSVPLDPGSKIGGVTDFDGDGDQDIIHLSPGRTIAYIDHTGNRVNTSISGHDVGFTGNIDGELKSVTINETGQTVNFNNVPSGTTLTIIAEKNGEKTALRQYVVGDGT